MTTCKVGLAPMEGVTDLATRLWFWLVSGPRYMTTPFLRITPGFPYKRIERTFWPEIFSDSKPSVGYQLVPQLMASDPFEAARIIEPLLEHTSFVEMNCGCPAPRVVGHGAGSGLLTTTDVFRRFAEPLVERFPGRVAIKMRLGLGSDDEFLPLFDSIKTMPLARLTIHGRTRENRYTGKSRWWPMAHAASESAFPVVGSGDVVCIQSFRQAMSVAPGLSGLIVGRGALRNPWVFQEIETGVAQQVEADVLYHALRGFACLQELAFLKPDALLELLSHELFRQPCAQSLEAWNATSEFLNSFLKQHCGAEHVFSRGTGARLKMVWNYLRSSLPEDFFEPTLFRFADTEAFLNAIRKISNNCGIRAFTFAHRADKDWVYAGEK